MKLISMTDFVISNNKKSNRRVSGQYHYILEYAKFLKQKLELCMFVPCKFIDGAWVILEEPICPIYENGCEGKTDGKVCKEIIKEYQEAKDICIFNSNLLPLDEIKNFISESKTLQFLANYHYEKTGSYLETNRELF